MIELRQPVAHHDFFRHADCGQRFPLELVRIGNRGFAVMQLHVDDRRGQIFHRREALVEGLRRLDLVDQFFRDRLTGLVMGGVGGKNIGRHQPVLVHLARIFDEIAGRAAEAGIGDVIVEIMQRMTKFVEQGRCIVEADQRRFAIAALDEIIIVRGRREIIVAAQLVLVLVGGHPRAGALALTSVVVKILYADHLVAALDFEGAHFRIEDRNAAGGFGEGQAV